MNKFLGLFLAVALTAFAPVMAGKNKSRAVVIEGHGDLHVLYDPNGSVRIVAARADGNLLDTTFVRMPKELKLHYFAVGKEAAGLHFAFTLHDRVKHSWRREQPAKTLVVSDLHGRIDALAALLKGNGVVDENLNWIYGNNQLIFLGDALDRGEDDNGIAWLLYKLEYEAERAGGRVDFLLGNHEDLVLRDDLRYVNEGRLIFAARAGIPYSGLYGSDTELGRWIRDSYLILVVGDHLFVHAGLSLELIRRSYRIGEINELARRFTGFPTEPRESMHPRNEFLFGSRGPFWYRGMVADTESNPAIPEEDLEKVLRYYGVKRVVVGHSEVDEVESRYDGRVMAVNVRHYDNFPADRTAGLLIEGDRLRPVTYSGKIREVNEEK